MNGKSVKSLRLGTHNKGKTRRLCADLAQNGDQITIKDFYIDYCNKTIKRYNVTTGMFE